MTQSGLTQLSKAAAVANNERSARRPVDEPDRSGLS